MDTPELPPALLRGVRIPSWRWVYPDADLSDLTQYAILDANAAYVSAASTVNIALNALTRTGPLDRFAGAPGYYRVRVRPDTWADRRIVSPLGGGSQRWDGEVWLPMPTVDQLAELHREEVWPALEIVDSWTSPVHTRLTNWTNFVRDERIRMIESRDSVGLAAIKRSYVFALQMMQGHKKCKIRRPDWYHAIHAAHRANMWRKAWRAVEAGAGPVRMSSVDEMVFGRDDLMIACSVRGSVRLDQMGRGLGTFKVSAKSKGIDQDPGELGAAGDDAADAEGTAK